MSVAGWPAEVDLDLGTSTTPALQHHQHQSRVKVKVKVQRCDEGRVETLPAALRSLRSDIGIAHCRQ